MFQPKTSSQEMNLKDHGSKTPFSLITQSQKDNSKVIINLRNNKKLISNIVAYDKHFNLVLKNCAEVGTLKNKNRGLKKKDGYECTRTLGNVYLRGDSIITISLIDEM